MQVDLVSFIKDGISAREVYQRALSYVKEKIPELEKHFVKNIGFGVSLPSCIHDPRFSKHTAQMGVEFRDSAYVLSAKNGRALKTNMIINLGLGLSDLVDPSGKKLA